MTPISTLPLEELAAMYAHAQKLQSNMKRNPYLYMWWKLTALEVDMHLLWQAMEQKIPASHQHQILSLTQISNK